MEKSEVKIGMRVVANSNRETNVEPGILAGCKGTVADIDIGIGVTWDVDVGGHGNISGKHGHDWYAPDSILDQLVESVSAEPEDAEDAEYQTGDRVVCTVRYDTVFAGMLGTVIYTGDTTVSIEWDKNVWGHDGDGKGKWGHCWNVCKSHIAPYTEENKTITNDTKELAYNEYVDMHGAVRKVNCDTDIKNAEMLVEQSGCCGGVRCSHCPVAGGMGYGCYLGDNQKLERAEVARRWLEEVKPSTLEEPEEIEYKVGDYIHILNIEDDDTGFTYGDIVQVVRIDPFDDDCKYKVASLLDSDKEEWLSCEDDKFEKATPDQVSSTLAIAVHKAIRKDIVAEKPEIWKTVDVTIEASNPRLDSISPCACSTSEYVRALERDPWTQIKPTTPKTVTQLALDKLEIEG